jgi:hypothetical protein
MNKFRNNLHPAFYALSDSGEIYHEASDERLQEIEAVEQQTREALDALADEIGRPDFSKVADSIVKEKKKTDNFKENKERFDKRLQSLNSQ